MMIKNKKKSTFIFSAERWSLQQLQLGQVPVFLLHSYIIAPAMNQGSVLMYTTVQWFWPPELILSTNRGQGNSERDPGCVWMG